MAFRLPHLIICAHYEHISELERTDIISLKETGWENKRIVRNLDRNNSAIGSYGKSVSTTALSIRKTMVDLELENNGKIEQFSLQL